MNWVKIFVFKLFLADNFSFKLSYQCNILI